MTHAEKDIIARIREGQARPAPGPEPALPEHRPDMLYIGCIDARLDPIDDIGIPKGKALIFRNVGAVVAGLDEKGAPRHLTEAASVQFAVNVMKVRHIVVAGHTRCGGLTACLHGCDREETSFVHRYLAPLFALLENIRRAHEGEEARAHAMEEGAVRQSVERLLDYPFVRAAAARGELALHGWVIDTASKRISEMDPATKAFAPMARHRKDG